MFRRLGLLSLTLLASSALFVPVSAFAQDQYRGYDNNRYYANGYSASPLVYGERAWAPDRDRAHEYREERREREWRERQRREWREHEWREHQYENRYRPYAEWPYRY